MVGIATDGASVMVGRHHSVYTLLKQRQPNLQLIRCVCHFLDIIAHKAMKQLPSNIDYLIRETYNWFSHSAKRQTDYKAIYETVNGGSPLKLLSPSVTRWLATADCIDRILDQEEELTLHFTLAANAEHCYAARLLSEMYKDKTNSLYLHFLRPLLFEIKTVNKNFQLETGDILAVFRDLNRLYMSTMRRMIKPVTPREFFSGSLDSLETQLINVASTGFSPNLAIDAFWLEVESFKDAGGNHCFQDLAFGAIKLLTLPISNAPVERAFSQVTLLKDDLRSRMGLPLLSGLMDVRTGLDGLTSATFRPHRQLLSKFDTSIYYPRAFVLIKLFLKTIVQSDLHENSHS
ncbi:hypothetical protein PO909_008556 [Leuciscus waleckii]